MYSQIQITSIMFDLFETKFPVSWDTLKFQFLLVEGGPFLWKYWWGGITVAQTHQTSQSPWLSKIAGLQLCRSVQLSHCCARHLHQALLNSANSWTAWPLELFTYSQISLNWIQLIVVISWIFEVFVIYMAKEWNLWPSAICQQLFSLSEYMFNRIDTFHSWYLL